MKGLLYVYVFIVPLFICVPAGIALSEISGDGAPGVIVGILLYIVLAFMFWFKKSYDTYLFDNISKATENTELIAQYLYETKKSQEEPIIRKATGKEEVRNEKVKEVIKQVNGIYIKKLENSKSKVKESSIKINGSSYLSSDWVADGQIQWFWEDNTISYGVKEKTSDTPYILRFELVEQGINVTGFPDDMYDGLYIKQ